jgi:hypothetical protein
MSEQGKEILESICDALKMATPEQKQYIVGFAEGMAHANESEVNKREQNDNE